MTDDLDTGHPATAEAPAPSAVMEPEVAPEVLVFGDVASLMESFTLPEARPSVSDPSTAGPDGTRVPETAPTPEPGPSGRGSTSEVPVRTAAATAAPHPAPTAGPAGSPDAAGPVAPSPEPAAASATAEVVTDEERTRYGLLLDSAAERGLLDPADYEIRLRELAEATTKAQMIEIVAELPAFTAAAAIPVRSRRSIQSANRTRRSANRTGLGAAGSHRRRVAMWVLMGVLVAVALASLVILALSAQRLSRSRSSSPPPAPVAARPVSALRL